MWSSGSSSIGFSIIDSIVNRQLILHEFDEEISNLIGNLY